MPRCRHAQTLVTVLGLGWIFSAALLAQVNTGTLVGTVADQTGAPIANATVTAKSDATAAAVSSTTNSAGQFTIRALPIGTYTVSASITGFRPEVRTGISLAAAQILHLDFSLQLGNVKETVTVSGEPPPVQYDSSNQLLTLGTQSVHNLPLQRLDWSGLLGLGNGVQTGGNSGVSLNGLPPAAFKITVDGTNASSDPELPSVGFYQGFNEINTINSEAIAEVSINKGITPASVSGTMSGNINIITKGGSNSFHGSLLEFNSVSAFNARNQFLKTTPRSTFNEFGGSLGGPIIHNKLFFFGDYEGVRLSSFDALNGTVPTPQFVASTLAVAPEYKSEFAVFPTPNQPYAANAVTGTWVGAGALKQNDNNTDARIDYYLNSTNWFTVRYTRARPFKDSPRVVFIDPRVTTGHSDSYNIQFTHAASSWTATTRLAYNRLEEQRLDLAYSYGLDEIVFSGFDSDGGEDFQKRGGTYTGEQRLAFTRGKQSIEVGVIGQRWNAGRIDDTTNTFSYSSLADFLANIPSQIQVNFPLTPFQLRMYQYGGFIQDDYRLLPNLTLNLGFRYDYFTVPQEATNRVFNRNASALGPGFGPLRPPTRMYNSDWANFSPRIGLAWAVGPGRKTVIRAGSGIFVNPHTIFGGPIEEVLDSPYVPFRLTLSRAQALAAGLSYPVNKAALLTQLEASGTPVANTAIGANFPNPYSIQWFTGVQRDLGAGFVLDASYVGNRALHLNEVSMENLPNRLTGVVPDPAIGSFRYYDGSDASWYDALQTSLVKRFSHGVNLGAYYTWSHNISYGDGDLELQLPPQSSNDIAAEKGPTPYDMRQSFRASFLYQIPISSWTGWNSRAAKLLVDGWSVSGIFTAQTGLPANITNGSSSYPADRPNLNTNVSNIFNNYTSSLLYLNAAAFVAPPIIKASGAQATPGDLGRYAIYTPGLINLDASLAKSFAITERVHAELRGDAFNSLNHTNLGGLVTDISKSNFGYLTSATPRTMQIGLKLNF